MLEFSSTVLSTLSPYLEIDTAKSTLKSPMPNKYCYFIIHKNEVLTESLYSVFQTAVPLLNLIIIVTQFTFLARSY